MHVRYGDHKTFFFFLLFFKGELKAKILSEKFQKKIFKSSAPAISRKSKQFEV